MAPVSKSKLSSLTKNKSGSIKPLNRLTGALAGWINAGHFLFPLLRDILTCRDCLGSHEVAWGRLGSPSRRRNFKSQAIISYAVFGFPKFLPFYLSGVFSWIEGPFSFQFLGSVFGGKFKITSTSLISKGIESRHLQTSCGFWGRKSTGFFFLSNEVGVKKEVKQKMKTLKIFRCCPCHPAKDHFRLI